MSKLKLVLLAALISMAFVFSCSSESDENGPNLSSSSVATQNNSSSSENAVLPSSSQNTALSSSFEEPSSASGEPSSASGEPSSSSTGNGEQNSSSSFAQSSSGNVVATSSSSVAASSSDSSPFTCSLTNAGTTGKVGTAINTNVFTVSCNGTVTNTLSWATNLTPTVAGNFTIEVSRPSTSNTCSGMTAICTIFVEELPLSNSSSSNNSVASSSSAAAGIGNCPGYPLASVPSDVKNACVAMNGKCYKCNPDRSVSDCSSSWLWTGNTFNSDSYWFVETACTGTTPSSSSVRSSSSLAPSSSSIAPSSSSIAPSSSSAVPSSSSIAPSSSSVAPSSSSIAPSSSSIAPSSSSASTISCANVPSSGTAGTAITPPTVTCNGSTVNSSNINWTSAPTWSNPAAGTYNSVKATPNTGACNGMQASCNGTLTVSNPTFSCANINTTVTAGTAITPPAVTCGSTTVASANITWVNAPAWANPVQGSHYSIQAKAVCGSSEQTANCSGSVVVNPKPSSSSVAPSSSSTTSGGGTVCSQCNDAVNGGSAKTTRYWDSCKPSCAWSGKPSNGQGTAKSCDISGSKLSSADTKNACESGGTAYTCMDQVPWKVTDNLSYGFAASHSDADCGKCFLLEFTSNGEGGMSGTIQGKRMVIMISNIGGDVGGDQFDLMIPGGGVGAYNALSNQVSQLGGSSSNLGQQYGGFRATCGNNTSCVQNMCNTTFAGSLNNLKAGCQWYIDWFGISNNPTANKKEITCPSELVAKYK